MCMPSDIRIMLRAVDRLSICGLIICVACVKDGVTESNSASVRERGWIAAYLFSR
jgi:hypothetical protein